MGNLIIKKVIYDGDLYHFETPELNEGLIIMEGVNHHGKSTFMNLIFFGLGGDYNPFNKEKKEKLHKEITNDTNNYVELHIELNDAKYKLTRHFYQNIIFISDEKKNVIVTKTSRKIQDDSKEVFSDWLLKKLDIKVFDVVQGINKFKINFKDLMRLIYYDQETQIDKIYKENVGDNYFNNTVKMRMAIFEVLMGCVYDDYYSKEGEFKLKSQEYNKLKNKLEEYDNLLKLIVEDDVKNVDSLNKLINENNNKIHNIKIKRELEFERKLCIEKNIQLIKNQKRELIISQKKLLELKNEESTVQESINKILDLIDEFEEELREIEKIRFVNKKLKLFSPNTCPYCLREVDREEGKCICGSSIDENQYEKFFYTEDEYLTILSVKSKSILSLKQLLNDKIIKIESTKKEINNLDLKINDLNNYIVDLSQDNSVNSNSSYIRQLDKKENDLYFQNIKLNNALKLSIKKNDMVESLSTAKREYDDLELEVKKLFCKAKEDIKNKKDNFSEKYCELMKEVDDTCFDANIGDDYMPNINGKGYIARSTYVPVRLLYFLTLLIESLEGDTNYPKFLMIDTPDNAGIDDDNLINNIKMLSKADDFKGQKYQIILTTGIDVYPSEFKDKVFYTLDNHLLKEK